MAACFLPKVGRKNDTLVYALNIHTPDNTFGPDEARQQRCAFRHFLYSYTTCEVADPKALARIGAMFLTLQSNHRFFFKT